MTTTISSREFNHNLGGAKKAAYKGPVFITDRGEPSHVLMTYQDYSRIACEECGIVEALSMKGLSGVEFEPGRAGSIVKDIDLS